jgi:hypothetical protein
VRFPQTAIDHKTIVSACPVDDPSPRGIPGRPTETIRVLQLRESGRRLRVSRNRSTSSRPGGGHRPNRREKKLPSLFSFTWPGHRSARRTPAITWSTCWPQPAQLALPHTLQVTCRHMGSPLVQRSPSTDGTRRTYTPGVSWQT